MKLRFLQYIIACVIAASIWVIFSNIAIYLQLPFTAVVQAGGDQIPSSSREEEGYAVAAAAAVANDGGGGTPHLPWFTLHVGPHKTGTTSIQQFLKLKETAEYLEQDGYSVILRNSTVFQWPGYKGNSYSNNQTKRHFFKWSSMSRSKPKVPLPKAYLEPIESAIEKGHNFLISDEILDRSGRPALRGLWDVIGTNFNVQVVQTYRRLHERLPSLYNQQAKRICGGDGIILRCTKWPSFIDDLGTKSRTIPTFQQYHQEKFGTSSADSNKNNNTYLFTYPNEVESIRRLYSLFKSSEKTIVTSRVFNMHQEGDMLVNFICQMIPSSNHTCQFVRDKALRSSSTSSSVQQELKRENEAVVLDYDRLAVQAQSIGLINASYYSKRQEVATRIQHYQEKIRRLTDKDLPQECPSPEIMDSIYKASLRMEEFAMPLIYPTEYQREWKKKKKNSNEGLLPQHLQDFHQSWQKSVDGNKLCHVDCLATLQLPEWKDFFAQEFPPPT